MGRQCRPTSVDLDSKDPNMDFIGEAVKSEIVEDVNPILQNNNRLVLGDFIVLHKL